ncbi:MULTISPECIES: nitroreductase family protein [unclassified Breznakia]|uniref:nitroreductase family protein n=1 Tax=unclassified Breznakia TaxID=2623764 RepID=UPI0024746301|nr:MULTISPECIES: nitroreductase family protein [unclassified Breznakia]MDH6366840.1 putative oxidoreductase (fatty acid repression mutant protein) [Breznakia sp. PH1-1]MDH6404018.1 putative oxidoreductase (fatty acid repression mutant protein) [Breznakia sp. PF1-11]MDH6411760.1 putative oxidoreductase (fatty acid repression mutant protein) [Breznakia sp. PFB1-11]MDH6414006.1 putative oxidoreductase (fatty acid repression mutant protein) [Breznakia sp. PFB1-14]MDH6416436.1 putative oxidoreducta
MKSILDSIKDRRTYYQISNEKVLDSAELEALVKDVAKHVPSPFNMQSQRIIVLENEQHDTFWKIVKETLRKIVNDPEKFVSTEKKIDTAFASGSATLLFFDDVDVVEGYAAKMPNYAENFRDWSRQANGMMQYAMWTTLESVGYGANLQHYNPVIDDEVKKTWNIPDSWRLVAQMPIGKPAGDPGDKEFMNIDDKVKIYK